MKYIFFALLSALGAGSVSAQPNLLIQPISLAQPVAFHPTQPKILFNGASTLVIWNWATAESIVIPHHPAMTSRALSPDGRLFAFNSGNKDNYKVTVLDTDDGSVRSVIPSESDMPGIYFSKNNAYLILDKEDDIAVFAIETAAKVGALEKPQNSGKMTASVAGDTLILAGKDRLTFISLPELKKIRHLVVQGNAMNFSDDGRYAFYSENDETLVVNTRTGAVAGRIPEESMWLDFPFLNAPSVSPDGSKVAIYYNYSVRKLGVYDLKSGRQLHLHDLSEKISRTLGIYFLIDPSWKFCAFINRSNALTLLDLETGATKCEIYNIGPLDFAIHTPEGYYMATRMGASQGVAFEKDGQLYDFDQFDLQFNKPDAVLAKVGQTPPAMVEAMKKARLKRLRLLGYVKEPDNFDLHVPVVELTGDLHPFTEKSSLNLSISAADSKEFLDRVMVYVNGVPLMGKNGFSIKNQQLKKYDKTIAVPLVAGDNIIEVEVYNVKGSRSLRTQQTVRCEIPAAKPDLYLVAIGVSTYADATRNLRYATKDAKDLIDLFTQKNKFYNKISTLDILEGDFSKTAFQKIQQLLSSSKEKDHVILFYAGHGLVDPSLDYYLAHQGIDFSNPAVNGIAYAEIEDLLDGIPARNRLILLDACFSGEIDKETAVLIQKENTQTGPVVFRSADQGLAAGNTEAERVYNLMRRWFVDLRAATGATVLTSSSGLEYAQESKQWENGAFTECLLNGLKNGKADANKDGQVMLSELRQYLAEEVPKLTSDGQRPTFRVENLSKDWRVW